MASRPSHLHEPPMQTLRVNGYDMAYLEVGESTGQGPLVCVHGSLCDFRIWSSVLGPLTQKHRVIAVSLRHFFPDRWDGGGDSYSIAQHVDRADEGPASALLQGGCRGDQDADAVHRRRQYQGDAAAGAACTGRQREGIAHRDDPGRHPSDVRTSAAEILRDRSEFSGGVSALYF